MKSNSFNNKIPWWVWVCGLSGFLGVGIFKNLLFNVKDFEFVGLLIVGLTVIVFLFLTALTTRSNKI